MNLALQGDSMLVEVLVSASVAAQVQTVTSPTGWSWICQTLPPARLGNTFGVNFRGVRAGARRGA